VGRANISSSSVEHDPGADGAVGRKARAVLALAAVSSVTPSHAAAFATDDKPAVR